MTGLPIDDDILASGAKPGQYLRFDCRGRWLETVDHLTNGLGRIYKINPDGATMTRVFF